MRKRGWLDPVNSLGEMNLKERRNPNSKGRVKPISQKERKGRKGTFKDILNEQNEVTAIQLLLLQGKEDQVLLHLKSALLLFRKPVSGTSLQNPDYQSQRVTPVSKATFPTPMIRSGKATPGVTECQPTLLRLEITKAAEHLGPKGRGRRRKHLVFESTSQANVLCHNV